MFSKVNRWGPNVRKRNLWGVLYTNNTGERCNQLHFIALRKVIENFKDVGNVSKVKRNDVNKIFLIIFRGRVWANEP